MAFGPNNLLSVTNGARHGVGPAVVAAGGRLAAFAIIQVGGRGLPDLAGHPPAARARPADGGRRWRRWHGRSSAIGNPQAILVFTAFVPQFVAADAYALSYLQLGLSFLVCAGRPETGGLVRP